MPKLPHGSDLILAAAFVVAALAEIWLRDLESLPALLILGVLVPWSVMPENPRP